MGVAGWSRRADAVGAAALAGPPDATGDGSGPCSSRGPRDAGRSECADTHTRDTARPIGASPPALAHRAPASRDRYPSVERTTISTAHARRLDRPRDRAYATCCRRTRAPTIFFREISIRTWSSRSGFEEWYFFSTLPEHLQLSSYCNWGGTSIADWQQLVPVPTGVDLQKQLDESRPYAVVGVGQRICAISKDPLLIQTFRRTVATLQGSAEG